MHGRLKDQDHLGLLLEAASQKMVGSEHDQEAWRLIVAEIDTFER